MGERDTGGKYEHDFLTFLGGGGTSILGRSMGSVNLTRNVVVQMK
jgi:hypothetical protein